MSSSSTSHPSTGSFPSLFVFSCLVLLGIAFPSPSFSQPQDRDANGVIDIFDLLLFLADFQPGTDDRGEVFSYTMAWDSTSEVTFDISDYFITTAGSTWHYTGMNGASNEDDFRWTVEASQQAVGSGKLASRFLTETDEATDDRNGDVDFWLVENNGAVEYWGLHLGKPHSIGGYGTIPSQDIVFTDPIEVGHAGLKIGDTVTDTAAGSAIVTVFLLGDRTVTGIAKSSFEYTGFLSTFDTPLGSFTNVLRLVVNLSLEFTIPGTSNTYNFEIRDNTFFLKKGVGMIAQDQDPDDNDAEIQGIDEGSVIVDGTPIVITAN